MIGSAQVAKLLVANPAQRLGCLKRGGRDVREHAFFKPVDFTELEVRTISARSTRTSALIPGADLSPDLTTSRQHLP